MKKLTSNIVSVNALSEETISAMFELYNVYYAGTNKSIFNRDLNNKQWVILLYDNTFQLRGFSTLALMTFHHAERKQRVMYSGDTIVDHEFWGQQELSTAWLYFAGKLKAEEPEVPLYWLLIVKGHRTYRYLSAFCQHYYPAWNKPTPEPIQQFMDYLGAKNFGNAYDALRGIVCFPDLKSHLQESFTSIPENTKTRPEIQYFLERNPNYAMGEELLCLCELSQDNLRPYARRIFNAGFNANQRACA